MNNLKDEVKKLVETLYGGLLPSENQFLTDKLMNTLYSDENKYIYLIGHTRLGKDSLALASGIIGIEHNKWRRLIFLYPAYEEIHRFEEEIKLYLKNGLLSDYYILVFYGKTHKSRNGSYPMCRRSGKDRFRCGDCPYRISDSIDRVKENLRRGRIIKPSNIRGGCPYYTMLDIFSKNDKVILVTHPEAFHYVFFQGLEFEDAVKETLVVYNESHRLLQTLIPKPILFVKYRFTSSGWLNENEVDLDTGEPTTLSVISVLSSMQNIYPLLPPDLADILDDVVKLMPKKILEDMKNEDKDILKNIPRETYRRLEEVINQIEGKITNVIIEFGGLDSLKFYFWNKIIGISQEKKNILFNFFLASWLRGKIIWNSAEDGSIEIYINPVPLNVRQFVFNYPKKVWFLFGYPSPSMNLLLPLISDKDIPKFYLRDEQHKTTFVLTTSSEQKINYINLLKKLDEMKYVVLIITTGRRKAENEVYTLENNGIYSRLIRYYSDYKKRGCNILVTYMGSKVAENLSFPDVNIVYVRDWVWKDISKYDNREKLELNSLEILYQVISRPIRKDKKLLIILPSKAWKILEDWVPSWNYLGRYKNVDAVIKVLKNKNIKPAKNLIVIKKRGVVRRDRGGYKRVSVSVPKEWAEGEEVEVIIKKIGR